MVLPLILGLLLFLMTVGTIELAGGEDFVTRIWLANAVLAAVMSRTSPEGVAGTCGR